MAMPVKVPPAAASYTPATQDPDLRSQINTALIRDGHVTKIQDHVLHGLHAHPTNWPSAVQTHALALLRSGEIVTFPILLRRVLDDVRRASHRDGGATPIARRAGGLALPAAMVNEALKITRECLDTICEMADFDDDDDEAEDDD